MRKRGRPPYPDVLTPREQEVLRLLRAGLSNPEIAERLGISRDGAKYHVSEILTKLGVSSREEAARVEGKPWWLAAASPFGKIGWSWRLALVPGAAAVAAATALLVWGLVRTNGTPPVSAALPSASDIAERFAHPGDVPEGWSTFTSEQYRFRISYPPAWQVTSDDHGVTLMHLRAWATPDAMDFMNDVSADVAVRPYGTGITSHPTCLDPANGLLSGHEVTICTRTWLDPTEQFYTEGQYSVGTYFTFGGGPATMFAETQPPLAPHDIQDVVDILATFQTY